MSWPINQCFKNETELGGSIDQNVDWILMWIDSLQWIWKCIEQVSTQHRNSPTSDLYIFKFQNKYKYLLSIYIL